jgi:Fe-S-cluster containining protein
MDKNIVDLVDEFYVEGDKRAERLVAEDKPSCTKGCHGCCFQLIGVQATEAIHIISKICQRPNIRDTLRYCTAAAQAIFAYKTATDGFRKKVPCVFLEGGLCQIYAYRPIVCRYYFVATPPEMCHPDSPTSEIMHYDMHTKAIDHLMPASIQFVQQRPAGTVPLVGPLPAMLVWAAATVFTGGDKIWAQKKLDKLPPISTWQKSITDIEEC